MIIGSKDSRERCHDCGQPSQQRGGANGTQPPIHSWCEQRERGSERAPQCAVTCHSRSGDRSVGRNEVGKDGGVHEEHAGPEWNGGNYGDYPVDLAVGGEC